MMAESKEKKYTIWAALIGVIGSVLVAIINQNSSKTEVKQPEITIINQPVTTNTTISGKGEPVSKIIEDKQVNKFDPVPSTQKKTRSSPSSVDKIEMPKSYEKLTPIVIEEDKPQEIIKPIPAKKDEIKKENNQWCVYSNYNMDSEVQFYDADIVSEPKKPGIPPGTRVDKIRISSSGEFYKIKLPDGRTGWVLTEKLHACQ